MVAQMRMRRMRKMVMKADSLWRMVYSFLIIGNREGEVYTQRKEVGSWTSFSVYI